MWVESAAAGKHAGSGGERNAGREREKETSQVEQINGSADRGERDGWASGGRLAGVCCRGV